MRRAGWQIAKILGIRIVLHPSWLIIFILAAISFSTAVVPQLYPTHTVWWNVGVGSILTTLLFASVVIHELAHALYARSSGLPIKRITLFVFGGAAEIEDDPKTPKQEFLMSIVGPLTSIALSFFFGLVLFIGVTTNITVLEAIGGILSAVNLLLAAFNMLPGFPLDGGRVLRSLLWKVTGSLERATRFAFISGQIFGFMLVALGVVQLFMYGMLGGVWLALIGYFLTLAASASYHQTMIRLKLEGKRVEDVMEKVWFVAASKPVQLHPSDPIQKAFDLMHKHQKPVLYVGENRRPTGIVTAEALQSMLNVKVPGIR